MINFRPFFTIMTMFSNNMLDSLNGVSAHHSQFRRHNLDVLEAGVDAHEDVGAPAHQHDPQGHTGVKLESKVHCVTEDVTQEMQWI